jgi:hypothetical protein
MTRSHTLPNVAQFGVSIRTCKYHMAQTPQAALEAETQIRGIMEDLREKTFQSALPKVDKERVFQVCALPCLFGRVQRVCTAANMSIYMYVALSEPFIVRCIRACICLGATCCSCVLCHFPSLHEFAIIMWLRTLYTHRACLILHIHDTYMHTLM